MQRVEIVTKQLMATAEHESDFEFAELREPERKPGERSRLGTALTVLLISVGISCTSDRPNLASDGDIVSQCTPYADLLVTFNGPGQTGGSDEGEAALGAPDGTSVEIAAGATLTVSFVGLGGIVNGSDDDLVVRGNHASGAMVTVFASIDPEGEQFTFVGSIEPEDDVTEYPIDLATGSVSLARDLRFVGQAESLFIDSIESLSSSCP
jgi:hypothetical protein